MTNNFQPTVSTENKLTGVFNENLRKPVKRPSFWFSPSRQLVLRGNSISVVAPPFPSRQPNFSRILSRASSVLSKPIYCRLLSAWPPSLGSIIRLRDTGPHLNLKTLLQAFTRLTDDAKICGRAIPSHLINFGGVWPGFCTVGRFILALV